MACSESSPNAGAARSLATVTVYGQSPWTSRQTGTPVSATDAVVNPRR